MLQKIGFQPGINKQISATGAEGQWIDCDNVRFRYGIPEKIGGWKQLGDDALTGAGRGLHHFVNSKSRKYAIIGTNRILYAYSGGVFYDIHPIKSTTTLTSAFTTTNGSATVTITFSGDHGISAQDIILLDSFSSITNSNFAAADFNDKKFMVTTVPSSTTVTITMPSNESGSGATTSGGIRVQHYYPVGPAVQAKGFGWSLGSWGGEVAGEPTTTLTNGITDSVTTGIILGDVSQFPSSGTNFITFSTNGYVATSVSNELHLGNSLYGNYHFVNKGNHTWYDAARIMAKYIGQEDAIKKITTDDFYTNLSRPKWTPLNPTKFERAFGEGNEKIPTYEEDIQNYLREMGRIE